MTQLPPLEEPCPDCNGAGGRDPVRAQNIITMGGPCNTCRGIGWMPTEAGNQILALVRHERSKGNLS